jgi:hypothetical protein
MLFVIKGYLSMKIVESIWLQRMAYMLCLRVVFPSIKEFVDDVFFGLVEKPMLTYVHPTLTDCISTTCTFDLLMSKGAHDVFIVVVNFLLNKWEAKHITIGLFEMFNITSATMAPRLQQLLDKFLFTQRSLLMLRMRALIYRGMLSCELVTMNNERQQVNASKSFQEYHVDVNRIFFTHGMEYHMSWRNIFPCSHG